MVLLSIDILKIDTGDQGKTDDLVKRISWITRMLWLSIFVFSKPFRFSIVGKLFLVSILPLLSILWFPIVYFGLEKLLYFNESTWNNLILIRLHFSSLEFQNSSSNLIFRKINYLRFKYFVYFSFILKFTENNRRCITLCSSSFSTAHIFGLIKFSMSSKVSLVMLTAKEAIIWYYF